MDEEKKLIEEALGLGGSGEEEVVDETAAAAIDKQLFENNIYFKKFIQLKRYVRRSEARFVELERANLRAIKQVYSLLNAQQKLQLIRNYFIHYILIFCFLFFCF